MRLEPGCRDPEGVQVRAVPGKEGIMSLDPSPLVNNVTAVHWLHIFILSPLTLISCALVS